MSQTPSKTTLPKRKASQGLLGSSELLRKLQVLLDTDLPQSNARFSERLTQNMDFNGSLKLSELHGHLRILEKKAALDRDKKPETDQQKALMAAYNRVHQSIVRTIQDSFDPAITQPRFALPKINLESVELDLTGYAKFYKAQQIEMSAKIQGLRTYVRETLSNSSIKMAKLALIDNTLEETIGFPLRSGFVAVAKIITSYSQVLAKNLNPNSHTEKQIQLDQFHNELQQLLLSELALRLQAIQGLLDAFNQEVS